jgi:Bacterial regulatory proteins, gntR family
MKSSRKRTPHVSELTSQPPEVGEIAVCKPGRAERIRDIRRDLLVDRDRNDVRLGVIDDAGLVTEHALARHSGGSRIPIRDALAALVARRLLSVIPGKGYEVALLTKDVVEQNKQVGYDSINGIRTELARTADAAFESISTGGGSAQERESILGEAEVQLKEAAKKADSNSVRDRGEAVFLATETLGLIGSAAGLRWGGDILRSALDIFEISTRWNRDRKNWDVFERPQVVRRVKTCKALLSVLTEPHTASTEASKLFSAYLDARVTELSSSIADDSRDHSRFRAKGTGAKAELLSHT